MNSRQIEQIAVNAVKDIFLQSEIFNPCIPDNDREPIWDGFIYTLIPQHFDLTLFISS